MNFGHYPPLFGSFINQGFAHLAYIPRPVNFENNRTTLISPSIANTQEGELGYNDDVSPTGVNVLLDS